MQAQMAEGKREMGAYLQARRHLRPFFKQLKTRSMPYDVLSTMVETTPNPNPNPSHNPNPHPNPTQVGLRLALRDRRSAAAGQGLVVPRRPPLLPPLATR